MDDIEQGKDKSTENNDHIEDTLIDFKFDNNVSNKSTDNDTIDSDATITDIANESKSDELSENKSIEKNSDQSRENKSINTKSIEENDKDIKLSFEDDNSNKSDKTEADKVENVSFGKLNDGNELDNNKTPTSVHKKVHKNRRKKAYTKSKVNTSIFGGIILITVILTISLVLAVSGIKIGMEYWGIGKSDNEVSFNIPKGSTNDDIATLLQQNGIIDSKQLFILAIKLEKPKAIYPGDITLKASSGYSDIIATLATMRESYKTVTVTIKEGETLLTVANRLEKKKVCSAEDFIFEFNKDQGFDFESSLTTNSDDSFYRMEGYVFPDTYEFYVGDTATNIAKVIRENFEKHITKDIKSKMKVAGLSLNQTITLASIVQLEAGSTASMPKIASVFLNRLNDADTYPMLQSDTTTNYINNVIRVQAETNSAITHYIKCYDTYKCKGLPAGAICNPGMDAINAVLNPAKTKYYYFCSNLKTKKTYYAKTLAQHEKNLKKAGLK